MADDKKRHMTDEDVLKLLDDMLGEVEGDSAKGKKGAGSFDNSNPFAQEDKEGAGSGLARELGQGEVNPTAQASEEVVQAAGNPVATAPESSSSSDGSFYVEEKTPDPRQEALRLKTQQAMERVEQSKQELRQIGVKLLHLWGETPEIRKKRFHAVKMDVGFAVAFMGAVLMLIYVYIGITLKGEHQYKEKLSAGIKETTGKELIIQGNIDFELFPTPIFRIGATQLKNTADNAEGSMVTIRSIDVKPSFFWLILNTIKVKEVTLYDPVVRLENYTGQRPNWKFFAKKNREAREGAATGAQEAAASFTPFEKQLQHLLSGKDAVQGPVKPEVLPTTSGGNSAQDAQASDKMMEKPLTSEEEIALTSEMLEKQFEQYVAGAKISIVNGKVIYAAGLKRAPLEREFTLSSAYVRANSLQGPFKVEAEILEKKWKKPVQLSIAIDHLAKERPEAKWKVKYDQTEISANGVMKKQGENWQATGDFAINGGSEATLKNMVSGLLDDSKSSLAKGIFTVSPQKILFQNMDVNVDAARLTMATEISFGSTKLVKLSLQGDKLDIDALRPSAQSQNPNKRNSVKIFYPLTDLVFGFSLPADIMLDINAQIKELTYNEHVLKQPVIDMRMGNNTLILRNIQLSSMPGGTDITADSSVASGGINGHLRIESADPLTFMHWAGRMEELPEHPQEILREVDISADTSMSGKHLTLNNIKAHFNDSTLKGNISIKPALGIDVVADVTVDTLDLVPFSKITSEAKQDNLEADTTHKMNVFSKLRYIDSWFDTLDIKMNIEKIMFEKQEISKLSGHALFTESNSDFKTLTFNSLFGKTSIKGAINHSKLRPEVNLEIALEKMDIAEIPKVVQVIPPTNPVKSRWMDDLLPLQTLADFDGNIMLAIDAIKYNDFTVRDFNTGLHFKDANVDFEQFRAIVFDSRLIVEGTMQVGEQPSWSSTISLPNLDIHQALSQLFGITQITGNANLTGSITFSGFSPLQWINTLQGSVNYISRGIVVEGFNLAAFIQRMPMLQSRKEAEYWVRATLKEGKNSFQFTSGALQISQGNMKLGNFKLEGGLFSKFDLNTTINLIDWTIDLKAPLAIGKKGYATTFTKAGSIDAPRSSWDYKPLEDKWEQLFYAGDLQ